MVRVIVAFSGSAWRRVARQGFAVLGRAGGWRGMVEGQARGRPVRVLISYAHDDAGHEGRVREFWAFLRGCGVDARLDLAVADRVDWTDWMGVPLEQVSAIERAGFGATEIRTLASYVEALGGRLDIV